MSYPIKIYWIPIEKNFIKVLTVLFSATGSDVTLNEFFFLAPVPDERNNFDFLSLNSAMIFVNSFSPVCLREPADCSLGGEPVWGSLWASGSVKHKSALPSEP